jgi:hypothetical protein
VNHTEYLKKLITATRNTRKIIPNFGVVICLPKTSEALHTEYPEVAHMA